MQRERKFFWAKTLVLLGSVPVLIWAFEYGPDAGNCGVPNEGASCATSGCHTGTANSFSGSVKVTFPNGPTYTPGAKQHLTVVITDAAQKRWGFQLTARVAGNPQTMAGSFSPTDTRTQVMCAAANLTSQHAGLPCPSNMPLQYAEHTLAGYQFTQSSPANYSFDWTPPATDVGNIVIYVAGNAANGDLTPNGDHIYTTSYTLTPASANAPSISDNGVVNGASFQPGIAAGSWVTIAGANLSTTTRSWRPDEIQNGALPTSLDGVSVTINGNPAAVQYISGTQINVVAPQDSALGPVAVVVTNGNGSSTPASAQLQAFSPAFFPWSSGSVTYAVATRQDGSWVGPASLFPGQTTPAKPGEVIILWGTGFGPTDPGAPSGKMTPNDGQVRSVTTAPTVVVGGVTAEYFGAALSPGFAALYQVAIRVPDSTPNGDIAITASAGGVQSPANVFINVQK